MFVGKHFPLSAYYCPVLFSTPPCLKTARSGWYKNHSHPLPLLFSLATVSLTASPSVRFSLLSMALLCVSKQERMLSVKCLNWNPARVRVFIFFFCRWDNWFHMCLIQGWTRCAWCSRHCWPIWSQRTPGREGCCRHAWRQGRKGTLSVLDLKTCCWWTLAKQAAQGCPVFLRVLGRWSW